MHTNSWFSYKNICSRRYYYPRRSKLILQRLRITIRFTMTGDHQRINNKQQTRAIKQIDFIFLVCVQVLSPLCCEPRISLGPIERRRLCVNTDFARLVQTTDLSNTDGDPRIFAPVTRLINLSRKEISDSSSPKIISRVR